MFLNFCLHITTKIHIELHATTKIHIESHVLMYFPMHLCFWFVTKSFVEARKKIFVLVVLIPKTVERLFMRL